jgi:hypothetical protein
VPTQEETAESRSACRSIPRNSAKATAASRSDDQPADPDVEAMQPTFAGDGDLDGFDGCPIEGDAQRLLRGRGVGDRHLQDNQRRLPDVGDQMGTDGPRGLTHPTMIGPQPWRGCPA